MQGGLEHLVGDGDSHNIWAIALDKDGVVSVADKRAVNSWCGIKEALSKRRGMDWYGLPLWQTRWSSMNTKAVVAKAKLQSNRTQPVRDVIKDYLAQPYGIDRKGQACKLTISPQKSQQFCADSVTFRRHG